MEENMMVNINLIKSMVSVPIHGKMVEDMWASGRTAKGMVEAK
jgi:hypothetical protein